MSIRTALEATAESVMRVVVFGLDDQRYGLPLSAVVRAIRAVQITKLPKAPTVVVGIINLRGQIIPVVNVRSRLGHAPRPVIETDHFLIARTSRLTLAIAVDEVEGTLTVPASHYVAPEKIVHGTEQLVGVLKLGGGLILIEDLERLLSFDEASQLSDITKKAAKA